VGTSIYVEEKAVGPLMRLHFEATEWSEPAKVAYRMTSGSGVKAYQWSCQLEATPPGTRFTFREEVELPFGVVGKLLGLVVQRSSRSTVARMLTTLKGLAEA
jgi:hypothetical protein